MSKTKEWYRPGDQWDEEKQGYFPITEETRRELGQSERTYIYRPALVSPAIARPMPLRIGNLIHTKVYGGPYSLVDADKDFGVKLAPEVAQPYYDVLVPIKDYGVPTEQEFRKGLFRTLGHLVFRSKTAVGRVYVGCAGGRGRTGLFLAGLAKVMSEYRGVKHRPKFDAVEYVRENYLLQAVETKEQEDCIAQLDVSDLVQWCCVTSKMLLGSKAVGAIAPAAPKEDVYEDLGVIYGRLKAVEEDISVIYANMV